MSFDRVQFRTHWEEIVFGVAYRRNEHVWRYLLFAIGPWSVEFSWTDLRPNRWKESEK